VATKQRSRARRAHESRDRGPRYVAPVLDPNWQNPYSPSMDERLHNQRVLRRFVVRRRLPWALAVGFVVVALVVLGVVVSPWLIIVAVVFAVAFGFLGHRDLARYTERGRTLGASMLETFRPGGDATERLRLVTVLDRLAATFGVDNVSAFVVADQGYNAALVPDGVNYSLFVTTSIMQDFELIELEGVVAHCLARQRLGLVERESLASVVSLSDESRRALAGVGKTYRADEVAAASIRYPLGLAGALRKCARQQVAAESFFSSATYAQWRWVFFDQWSERTQSDLSDLDDVELRARALEEW
jgi:Zn-dependent protease with chaperone function